MAEMKKILFFDDESFISRILVNNLKLNDWDVTFVSEINELFKELKRHKFDILILDIKAPIPKMENLNVSFTRTEIEEMDDGMNTGVVLAKKIWMEIDSNYAVLFLSARNEGAISQLSSNYRFDHIRKPELISTIIFKLNELLNQ